MSRLFIAIDLPAQIKGAVAGLCGDLPGARWVGAEELHLTLRFLGDVDDETLPYLKDSLSEVAFSSFSLSLCGVGHFPPGRHPRVLWVGMEPCPPLLELQRQIELAVVRTGLVPEERRFSPHITLARFKESPGSGMEEYEVRHGGFACSAFPVNEFILYSSILTRQGAIHTKEAIYPALDAPPHADPAAR